MRDLLGNTTKRRLEIIEELNRQGTWVTSLDLSKQLSVSLRTIASDIKYINEKGRDYFWIETSKKSGIRLIPYRHKQLSDGYKLFYQASEAFHFIEHIFYQPDKSSDFRASHFYYSDSTSYRLTNSIASSCNSFNLSLNLNPCYLHSENEEQVRQFYSHYFSEAYDQAAWPYPLDQDVVYNLTHELYKLSGLYYDDFILLKGIHLVAVSLIRYQQGFLCQHTDVPSEIIARLKNNPTISSHLNQLGMPSTSEFLADFFYSIYFLKATWQPTTDLTDLYDQLDTFITVISTAFGITIDETSRQDTLSVLAHIYFKFNHFPKEDYILFDRYAANTHALEKVYPNYIATLGSHLLTLEETMAIPWHSQFKDKVFYWLLITWKDLPSLLMKKQHTVKLVILNHLGGGHGHMLASLIASYFPNQTHIRVYSDTSYFNTPCQFATLKDYDYIIATSMPDHFQKERTIVTEPIPTERDWQQLKRIIGSNVE